MAKNHAHYFKNSTAAATAASLASTPLGESIPPSETTLTPDQVKQVSSGPNATTVKAVRHKVSQSSTAIPSSSTRQLQAALQPSAAIKHAEKPQFSITGGATNVIETMHRRFQPLGSWHSPEALAASNSSSDHLQQHFTSTQSLGLSGA